MIWFTSDHHFGHTNIIKYCERPFRDAEEMDFIMAENWNSVIHPDDTVYYVGDLALHYTINEATELVHSLNGYKILIRGNHDDRLFRPNEWLKVGFSEVHTQRSIQIGSYKNVIIAHHPRNYATDTLTHYRVNGHVHTSWKTKGRSLNVSVDVHNFMPVSELDVLDYFSTMEQQRSPEYYAK